MNESASRLGSKISGAESSLRFDWPTVYLENYHQFIIEGLVFNDYFDMVNCNCAFIRCKIAFIPLINGMKLPVTLTLVEVMNCRVDICMYACV